MATDFKIDVLGFDPTWTETQISDIIKNIKSVENYKQAVESNATKVSLTPYHTNDVIYWDIVEVGRVLEYSASNISHRIKDANLEKTLELKY